MADKKGGKEVAKSKKSRQLWTRYEVQDDKLVRKNKFSPKSQGDFLADHKDRRTCGKTQYMEKK